MKLRQAKKIISREIQYLNCSFRHVIKAFRRLKKLKRPFRKLRILECLLTVNGVFAIYRSALAEAEIVTKRIKKHHPSTKQICKRAGLEFWKIADEDDLFRAHINGVLHTIWMLRLPRLAAGEGEIVCLSCGCRGNNECGHVCLAAPEHYCELDINEDGEECICYCCKYLKKALWAANKSETQEVK